MKTIKAEPIASFVCFIVFLWYVFSFKWHWVGNACFVTFLATWYLTLQQLSFTLRFHSNDKCGYLRSSFLCCNLIRTHISKYHSSTRRQKIRETRYYKKELSNNLINYRGNLFKSRVSTKNLNSDSAFILICHLSESFRRIYPPMVKKTKAIYHCWANAKLNSIVILLPTVYSGINYIMILCESVDSTNTNYLLIYCKIVSWLEICKWFSFASYWKKGIWYT